LRTVNYIDCDIHQAAHPELCVFTEKNTRVVWCTAIEKCGLLLRNKKYKRKDNEEKTKRSGL
jgi:hypothetical protein